jgi:hypothetical protein
MAKGQDGHLETSQGVEEQHQHVEASKDPQSLAEPFQATMVQLVLVVHTWDLEPIHLLLVLQPACLEACPL